jgi:TPR repeat protein
MMHKSLLKKLGFIVVVTLVLSASQSVWGGFQEGYDAYKRGDYATAFKEWKPLAEEGNPNIQFALGEMYEKGKGVQKDYKLAVKWYRKSAELGNADAQHSLGMMYVNGLGVPEDYTLASNWFRKSADQGYVRAQYNLGLIYFKGEGVP